MDEKKTLPYHGFEYKSQTKYGIIGWGRAVGWLLLGVADTLKSLPIGHHKYNELTEVFAKLMKTVSTYQKDSGAFAWQLEAIDGPEDSSATAMIAEAVITGMESEVLHREEDIRIGRKLIDQAIKYISKCEKNGKIYHCSGECLGFSQYPQVYDAYPWSLGSGITVLISNITS